jgi:aspartate kinase
MKFGGTSVGDAACMRQVAALVSAARDRAPLVVLSAMSKVTDELLAMARVASAGDPGAVADLERRLVERHRACAIDLFEGPIPASLESTFSQLLGELATALAAIAEKRGLDARSVDRVAAIGERLSSAIFAAYLATQGGSVVLVDARDVIVTDDAYGAAQPRRDRILERVAERLVPLLAPGRSAVTQGYIGRTESGESTTLGRGGSDLSASLLGAALRACEIQIWTDVEGVMSADPRVVAAARPIETLSFAEAGELAAFGAKVLHPATIQPAVDAGIPVTVRHTQRPDGRFTTITANLASGRAVAAIASRSPISVFTVASPRMLNQPGFLARLFDVFARRRVSIDLVATAEVSVSLTVESDAPIAALGEEIGAFAEVRVAEDRAIVAIVGEHLRTTTGVCSKVFAALDDLGIELISMGANDINLSVVVPRAIEKEVVRRLHRVLIENEAAEPGNRNAAGAANAGGGARR